MVVEAGGAIVVAAGFAEDDVVGGIGARKLRAEGRVGNVVHDGRVATAAVVLSDVANGANLVAEWEYDFVRGILVGEKLMTYARSGEGHPDIVAELPAFAQRVRQLFTSVEIRAHFARAEHAALVEPDILKGATADEVEDFEDLVAERKSDRDRRAWVQAMLLRTGN